MRLMPRFDKFRELPSVFLSRVPRLLYCLSFDVVLKTLRLGLCPENPLQPLPGSASGLNVDKPLPVRALSDHRVLIVRCLFGG